MSDHRSRSGMWAAGALTAVLLLPLTGCGSDNSSEAQSQAGGRQAAHRQQQERLARRVHRAEAQAARRAARRRARRHTRLLAARQQRAQERQGVAEAARREAEAIEEAEVEEEASECDPNYSGACLNPDASDYDCEGGSGNGPYYTGEVTVIGVDHYGLDANGNGVGCEAE